MFPFDHAVAGKMQLNRTGSRAVKWGILMVEVEKTSIRPAADEQAEAHDSE